MGGYTDLRTKKKQTKKRVLCKTANRDRSGEADLERK